MAKETAIKKVLREKGWSYSRAATTLGVHRMHVYKVANGLRTSRRLGLKILNLPSAPAAVRAARRRGL